MHACGCGGTDTDRIVGSVVERVPLWLALIKVHTLQQHLCKLCKYITFVTLVGHLLLLVRAVVLGTVTLLLLLFCKAYI